MADRNKTELTQNITRNCSLWLDGKGFKPVETEVCVTDGWIADVAGVITPTMTELLNLKLISRMPNRKVSYANYTPPSDELLSKQGAWRKELDFLQVPMTALIEVKASVSDFKNDRKWKLPSPTNLRLIAMPVGMIDPKEWPNSWGIILFNKTGEQVVRYLPPAVVDISHKDNFTTVLNLSVSRDHKTRYSRIREWQKQVRLEDVDRKTIARIGTAIEFVKNIIDGKTIDEAKMYSSIRCEIPEYIMEHIENLKSRLAKNINSTELIK